MLRVVLSVLALVAAASTAAVALSPDPPRLAFDETVPADLRALAAETWDTFVSAHPARVSCIEPLTLTADWELDTRAEYRPATATAVVRIPGTRATLNSQLVHEFAHHLEFTCPEQEELRAALLVAQGLSRSTPWFEGESWESTPSEQYAEATVEFILGRRAHRGNIRISAQTLEVVSEWALGS